MKKKITIVSSIVILETQKKPGITARNKLERIAVFGPYKRLASSNTIQIESNEKVAATSLPVSAPIPRILKNIVANRS